MKNSKVAANFISDFEGLKFKLSSLSVLLNAQAKLIESIGTESNIDLYQKEDAIGLILKLNCQMLTFLKIVKNQLNDQDQVYDISSLQMILRSSYEAYLIFHYIFVNPETLELREFRYLCWDIAGYTTRENMPATTLEHQKRKDREKTNKAIQISKINKNPFFIKLSAKKQNALLSRSNWKPNVTWADLSEIAGFDRKTYSSIYSMLCDHSHSGRLSITQFMQSFRNKEMSITHIMSLLNTSCAMLAKSVSDLQKSANTNIEFTNAENSSIFFWTTIGNSLGKKITTIQQP